MPKFKCENPSCDNREEETIPHVKFIFNEKTLKLEAKEAACPVCGEQRASVKEPGPLGMPWFKAEGARNYNNKVIKQYDYDRDAAHATRGKLSKGI